MKNLIGIVAVILAFVAYIPYFRDIIKGKTKPHVYTWFVWGLVTTIIFALQLSGGGGAGTYVTLTAGIFSFIVFGLGLKNGSKDITRSDTIFFIMALISIGLWLLAKQPTLSIILLCAIDMMGFAPTVRKSWNKPFEETLFTWELNGFRHGLSLIALSKYNLLTLLYPLLWTIANVLFSVMIIARRKSISKA